VVISMRLRLQDINEALDAMLTGTEGRVVVTFD
jgi:Zn-dependent alcohol dehydrogenase